MKLLFALLYSLFFITSASYAADSGLKPETKAALALISETNPEYMRLDALETRFWFEGAGVAWFERVGAGEVNYGDDIARVLNENGILEPIQQLVSIYDTAVACAVSGGCQTEVFCAQKYDLYWDVLHSYQYLYTDETMPQNMLSFLRNSCPASKVRRCGEVNTDGVIYETTVCQ
jgi:hypothetical protein